MYDAHVLDMFEFGIEKFKSLQDFHVSYNWYTLHTDSWYFLLLLAPSPPLDNIQVMVIVWRLRGNIIRIALCWIV